MPQTRDPGNVAGAGANIEVFVPGASGPNSPEPTQPPVVTPPGTGQPPVAGPQEPQQPGQPGQPSAPSDSNLVVDAGAPVSPVAAVDGAGESILRAALDQAAAQNAERTTVTDVTGIRARATDGNLTLNEVRQAIAERQDQVLEITAEVEVGALSVQDPESGEIDLNCELPDNLELQQCRLDVGSGG